MSKLPDLTTKNVTIAIILGMDLLFFAVAIASYSTGWLADMRKELWALFLGTNQSLFLVLNSTSKPESSSSSTPAEEVPAAPLQPAGK